MKPIRRTGWMAAAAIVLAACSGGAATTQTGDASATASSPSTESSGCVVGVAWDDRSGGRWTVGDEPAIKQGLSTAGATYISNDASSGETQASNVESLIAQGATVLIIVAHDGAEMKDTVAHALGQGIAVIAYDRLIEDAHALYVSFDNVEVGRMQARAVLAAAPKGNYVIIEGDKADANAHFLRDGYGEALKGAADSGAITIVGETYTDSWDPTYAQTEMEQFLKANHDEVVAVLSENDGMADGVVAALDAHGLAGKVAVSGQDGDPAALNRVALGTQTVDVWKDVRQLGAAAADAAVQLCGRATVDAVDGTAAYTTPGGIEMSSILLAPQAITSGNLAVVLDAGWITTADLCVGVTAGSVAGCP